MCSSILEGIKIPFVHPSYVVYLALSRSTVSLNANSSTTICDQEFKRRAQLTYSEEEIRQKVGTFRQMLMEKEGVITREGSNPRPP
ncbi:serine/arginine repetitive matrix protein 3 [Tachysurus ichikawai]